MKKKILEKRLLLALYLGGILTFPVPQAEAAANTVVLGEHIISNTTIDTTNANSITATAQGSNPIAVGVSNGGYTVTLTGAKGLSITAIAIGDSSYGNAKACGIDNYEEGTISIGGNSAITVTTTGGSASATSGAVDANGIYNEEGTTNVAGNSAITVTATGGSASATSGSGFAYADADANGIDNEGAGTISIGGNSAITVTATGGSASATSGSGFAYVNAYGIDNEGTGTTTSIGGNSVITVAATGGSVSVPSGSANAEAYGIYNEDGTTNISGNSVITVMATGGSAFARSGYADAVGIDNEGGTTSIGENSVITVTAIGGSASTSADAYAIGIATTYDGTVTLQKNVTITTKATAADGDAYANALYTNGGIININQDKAYTVKLTGDIVSNDTDGIINLNLTNSSSFLQGNVLNNGGTINFTLANGAVWEPVYDNTNGTITYANNNSLNGYSTIADTISSITLFGGIIDLTWDDAARSTTRTLNIGTLSGTGGTVKINTDLANTTGDSINISSVTSASTLGVGVNYDSILSTITSPTIITANDGGYAVAAVTTGASNLTLTGVAEEYGAYKIIPILDGTNITGLSVGVSSNTKGAASAGLRNGQMIQVSMNHLRKRMGELRNDGNGENGIWARTYGGKISDNKYGYNESRYNGLQIGYDKKQEGPSGKKYTGGAVSYIMSNDYFATGSGNSYDTDLALYQTWIANNGHYSDIILKHGYLENKYGMTDLSSNYSSADYHTQTNSISAEYGYRKLLKNHWYAEPQMELTYGHIDSVDYTTSSGMKVQQDGIDRLIGRVGIGLGKTLDNGNHIYTSLSALHEFKGEESIKASSLNYSEDMSGTWGEFIVGVDAKLSKHSTGYLNVEKLFSGDVSSNWQFNAGCRFTF